MYVYRLHAIRAVDWYSTVLYCAQFCVSSGHVMSRHVVSLQTRIPPCSCSATKQTNRSIDRSFTPPRSTLDSSNRVHTHRSFVRHGTFVARIQVGTQVHGGYSNSILHFRILRIICVCVAAVANDHQRRYTITRVHHSYSAMVDAMLPIIPRSSGDA